MFRSSDERFSAKINATATCQNLYTARMQSLTLQNWVSTRYTIRYKRISIIVSESIFGEGAM